MVKAMNPIHSHHVSRHKPCNCLSMMLRLFERQKYRSFKTSKLQKCDQKKPNRRGGKLSRVSDFAKAISISNKAGE